MKFLVRDFNVHHLSSQGLSGIKVLRTKLIVSCSLKTTVTVLEKLIHTRPLLSSCSLLNSTDQLPDGPITQYGTHSLRHGFESMNGSSLVNMNKSLKFRWSRENTLRTKRRQRSVPFDNLSVPSANNTFKYQTIYMRAYDAKHTTEHVPWCFRNRGKNRSYN